MDIVDDGIFYVLGGAYTSEKMLVVVIFPTRRFSLSANNLLFKMPDISTFFSFENCNAVGVLCAGGLLKRSIFIVAEKVVVGFVSRVTRVLFSPVLQKT